MCSDAQWPSQEEKVGQERSKAKGNRIENEETTGADLQGLLVRHTVWKEGRIPPPDQDAPHVNLKRGEGGREQEFARLVV